MLFLPEEDPVNKPARPFAHAAALPPHSTAGERLVRVGALHREKDGAEHRGQELIGRHKRLMQVVAENIHAAGSRMSAAFLRVSSST